MFFKRFSKTPQRAARKQPASNQYESLEDRKMLAVTSLFDAGGLTISLTESGDTVNLVTDGNGNVAVNGELVDGDTNTAGIQTVGANQVTAINFNGLDGLTDLTVQMGGSFNTGSLNAVLFNNINEVVLTGNYVTGSLSGDFSGDGGFFADTPGGSIVVQGATNLNSSDQFNFVLNNGGNDFVNSLSITTEGNVDIRDSNGVNLDQVSAQNLTVNAVNSINDTVDANITVNNLSTFAAAQVNLGNDNAVVDLFTLNSNTTGNFSLNNIDAFGWRGSSVLGSANITAGNLVSMGPGASVDIIGDAVFDVARLRLGVGGSNTFNSGRINVQSEGNAFIFENSGVQLFGENTAPDLSILATGPIVNQANTTITVDGITSLQSTGTIDIGNAAGDLFNSGEVRFFGNDVNYTEDSSTRIGGLANFAVNLSVNSEGFISDTNQAFIVVQENATFISSVDDAMEQAGVQIGDTEGDFFIAGSVSFDVTDGNFSLSENDGTVVASPNGFVNTANAANIRSAGDLINDIGSIVDIDTTAILAGSNIAFGQAGQNDNVQFGSVTLTTNGNATLDQDSRIFLTGNSFVGGNVVLVADGAVEDSSQSFFRADGDALIFGTEIDLGDLDAPVDAGDPGDVFSVGRLRFGSGGDVSISHNGNLVLMGDSDHSANVLRLTATSSLTEAGTISNEAGANLFAQGNFFVTANSDVTLGANASDTINFDNLNFSALGNVDITANFANPNTDSSIFIFGTDNNPNTANELRLTTNVDVFDGTNAVIDVDEFIRVESRNLVLGDTDTDCVMLPDDTRMHEFVTTDGPAAVFADASCPATA